ncbi:DUF3153 domain-containing protein [Sharpea azabuensis]|uniref:DUF3153 domain-containing protein n=2 Tax=Sharpea porci TaxID=2652286 RepID=A0A844FV55_9FIRM|nr:DUF3153 domain-containing protein [Sharpea porci]
MKVEVMRMKKRFKSLSLILLAFLLSGCMKMNMTLDVSGNGKVKTSVRMLASEDTLKTSGMKESEFTESLKKQFTKNNKDVSAHVIKETHDGKKYIGVEASNAMSSSIKAVVKNGRVQVTIPMKTFTSALTDNNITSGTLNNFNMNEESLKKNGVEMKLVFNMPDKAKSNIGEVKGNKVTVDLLHEILKTDAKAENIVVSSKTGKTFDAKILFLIIGGLALIIAIILYALKKSKKK